ncbi:MAG: peptide chain release factor aRF-1 [Candidatus Bathyarchaeia archaeon]
MTYADSVSRFKLKKLIDSLASKEGRGTELISLYIPPGKKIPEVLTNLREEYGTASNIKSRTTRKNVQDAIEKVIQRLKLFKNVPPNGLAVFCGAIPQNGSGTERMEIYVLAPPEPINVYFYRCDNRFHLNPLLEILHEREAYAILLIDVSEATLASLVGRRMEILEEFTSGIPGKHRAGGQSARRFERIREAEINEFFKRVGNHVNEVLGQIQDLKGIIIGGPGPTKYDFQQGDYLNYVIKQKIIATIDTAYVGESGVKEAVSKSSETLKGVRYAEEKKLIQRFLYEVGHDTGLAVYGEREVRKHLNDGLVETLLLSEKLNVKHVFIKCKNCDYKNDRFLMPYEIPKFEQALVGSKCPKCSKEGLMIDNMKDLIDEYIEVAEEMNINVEIISVETEEGVMLNESFGGIAALLKYKYY